MNLRERVFEVPHPPPVLPRLRRRRRRRGPGVAAQRTAVRRRRRPPSTTRWPRRSRTSRRKRRASSTCTWPAPRPRSTCSTTSRSSRNSTASPAPTRTSRASSSPSSRASRNCSARRTSSPSTANPGRKCRRSFPTCRRWPTSVHRAVDVHRAVQPRPGPAVRPTGSPRLGRPGMGAWLSYGLGTENRNLPSFCVLVSGTAAPDGGASLWGSGFLPTIHQGVQLRSQGEPVLFLSNPGGMDAAGRRQSLDTLRPSTNSRLAPSATRKSPRALRNTTGLPDADQRAGSDGRLEGDEGDPRNVRRRAGPEGVRQQLPAGPAAGGERRALRAAVPLGLGQPRRVDGDRSAARPGRAVQGDGPARDGADQGPEAARPARTHAGRLGRRVRPDADERGAQRLEVAGPRPPPAHVHDLDGRRRVKPGYTHGATDELAITSPKTASTSTTCRPPSCT